MPINVGKLRRLLKSKLPYIERNVDAVISVIRRSMQNAAAFEPVVQSLKTWHPGTVRHLLCSSELLLLLFWGFFPVYINTKNLSFPLYPAVAYGSVVL